MADVESFALDHTAVKAPYVRLIGVEEGPRGDRISNFDVRLVQPNEGEIPTSGLHTIEHLPARHRAGHHVGGRAGNRRVFVRQLPGSLPVQCPRVEPHHHRPGGVH